MKKIYRVTNSFWVGELNKQLKENTLVCFDEVTQTLELENKEYSCKNLLPTIKIGWLVPEDGKYPELDGPVGETPEQAADRRRKERFVQMEKTRKEATLTKDNRYVGKVGGAIDEEKDPKKFSETLNVEPVASNKKKSKFKTEIVEDDTRVVNKVKDTKELKNIKKALNPKKDKKVSNFPIVEDHFDAEATYLGKYEDTSKEAVLKDWTNLHWTKKEKVVKTANKEFLKKINTFKNPPKITKQIKERLKAL